MAQTYLLKDSQQVSIRVNQFEPVLLLGVEESPVGSGTR